MLMVLFLRLEDLYNEHSRGYQRLPWKYRSSVVLTIIPSILLSNRARRSFCVLSSSVSESSALMKECKGNVKKQNTPITSFLHCSKQISKYEFSLKEPYPISPFISHIIKTMTSAEQYHKHIIESLAQYLGVFFLKK